MAGISVNGRVGISPASAAIGGVFGDDMAVATESFDMATSEAVADPAMSMAILDVASEFVADAKADLTMRARSFADTAGAWALDALGQVGGIVDTYGVAAFAIAGVAGIGVASSLYLVRGGVQAATPSFDGFGLDEDGQRTAIQVYRELSGIISEAGAAGQDLSKRTVFVTTTNLDTRSYDSSYKGKLIGVLKTLKDTGIRVGLYTAVSRENALKFLGGLSSGVQGLLRGEGNEVLIRDGRYINDKVRELLRGVDHSKWWLEERFESQGSASHIRVHQSRGNFSYQPPRILEPGEILLQPPTYYDDDAVVAPIKRALSTGHNVNLTPFNVGYEMGLNEQEKISWRTALLNKPRELPKPTVTLPAAPVWASWTSRFSWVSRLIEGAKRFLAGTTGTSGQTGAPAVIPPPEIGSLKDLRVTAVEGTPARGLLDAMLADVFYQTHPFISINMETFTGIIEHGIVGFERTIFRTTENVKNWNSGYDMVRYEIQHPDGTVSIIDAFKRVEGPYDIVMLQDGRPLFHNFFVSDGNGQMTISIYKNGAYQDGGQHPYEEGLGIARNFVDRSIANKGLTRLKYPDEKIMVIDRR